MAEYFLDTNIFMYAAGKPQKFKEPCVTVLSSVASGDLSAAVDAEVFQEYVFSRSTSPSSSGDCPSPWLAPMLPARS
jgi:predicted nucleic acid-binding protein